MFVDDPTSDVLCFNKLSCYMRNSQKTETKLENRPMEWQTGRQADRYRLIKTQFGAIYKSACNEVEYNMR